jgi:hypothetical protein
MGEHTRSRGEDESLRGGADLPRAGASEPRSEGRRSVQALRQHKDVSRSLSRAVHAPTRCARRRSHEARARHERPRDDDSVLDQQRRHPARRLLEQTAPCREEGDRARRSRAVLEGRTRRCRSSRAAVLEEQRFLARLVLRGAAGVGRRRVQLLGLNAQLNPRDEPVRRLRS